MSLIKMPYEVSPDLKLKVLLYGQPGIGKSTLAVSAPNPVLIDCDNGIQRIAPSHRPPFLPVSNYAEITSVLNSDEIKPFDTIIIDTAGKLLDYMAQHIIKENPKMGRKDGALTLQGYGVRKYEFISLLKRVAVMGKHLIFVAHESEERSGDDKVVRPEVGGSSGGDLIKELDLVGYMEALSRKRTISFTPCDKYYAKNSARLPEMLELPELQNGQPNCFMSDIITKCQTALKEESEQVKKYNELIRQIGYDISGVIDVESANKVFYKLSKYEHIWDSKPKSWELLQLRASELSLTFDAKDKKYEAKNIPQPA